MDHDIEELSERLRALADALEARDSDAPVSDEVARALVAEFAAALATALGVDDGHYERRAA